MSRIFVTGDCHAEYHKFSSKQFPESRDLTKDDYMIICGDFGYWDQSEEQNYWMDWLNDLPFSVLWIDGNHENYDLLARIPVEKWKGGKVQFIRPSVIHLMRGQLFTIDQKRYFTFGGARSHDICDGILELHDPNLMKKIRRLEKTGGLFRINHYSWRKEEMPSEEERQEGLRILEQAGWKTDYIISHCFASDMLLARAVGLMGTDEQTDYFQLIRKKCHFRHWFFGHYHLDEDWSEKETCLYRKIVELTEEGRYISCGAAAFFKCKERVQFRTYNKKGDIRLLGTIVHISPMGRGLYAGDQPTANIRTDDGFYHKNIPFEDIFKIP